MSCGYASATHYRGKNLRIKEKAIDKAVFTIVYTFLYKLICIFAE